jgi:hypothetical protein
MTEADQTLFEDGVDMVGYPAGLSGRWADDWGNELRDRVQRSDVIALLTVNTFRTDVSPAKRSTHWLVTEVGDVLKGEYQGELSLASSDDALGFDSVERERSGLLRKPLVLFAKWVRDDTGLVRARWHLATASQDIVHAVRAQIEQQKSAGTRTTVEHTQ